MAKKKKKIVESVFFAALRMNPHEWSTLNSVN